MLRIRELISHFVMQQWATKKRAFHPVLGPTRLLLPPLRALADSVSGVKPPLWVKTTMMLAALNPNAEYNTMPVWRHKSPVQVIPHTRSHTDKALNINTDTETEFADTRVCRGFRTGAQSPTC